VLSDKDYQKPGCYCVTLRTCCENVECSPHDARFRQRRLEFVDVPGLGPIENEFAQSGEALQHVDIFDGRDAESQLTETTGAR